MDEEIDRYTIGELARRTGLSARTIRFWSDSAVIPPLARSAGGYRLYGADAVGRLRLIRTLRELGLGLDAVREVLDRQSTLAEVAAIHVDALDTQIRILQLNRAVLRNATCREHETEGLTLMYELARLSAQQRQQLIDGFVDTIFAGVDDADALAIADFMREMPPQLPDDPTSAQVDAWIELAELVRDNDFGHTMRQMVLRGESDNRIEFGLNIRPLVLEHAAPAVGKKIAPESDAGRAILDRIVPTDLGDIESQALLEWLALVAQPRVERYWELLSLINNRSPAPASVPAFAWLATALRAHRQSATEARSR
ncbi:MerR family transcriptional regulator [Nocardia alba]|uniref:DNA-binding transcriptional MerR regulator n=1 Tax=Nocardia alba TaxID=225051 RepID=A0A4R1FW20_9NOCA|nr:MerR family transcriptional regulator [Nocardia alba]TCJ96828.1 DNA-binding transcriptional MerR regulator [Nocardia alba]